MMQALPAPMQMPGRPASLGLEDVPQMSAGAPPGQHELACIVQPGPLMQSFPGRVALMLAEAALDENRLWSMDLIFGSIRRLDGNRC